MNENSRKAKNRLIGSGYRSIVVSNGVSAAPANRKDTRAGRFINIHAKSAPVELVKDRRYIGPADEGTSDVRYVEAVGGTISDRKPSFIR
ncbi:hypothetical protein NST84_08190 [Paenibacillus sp. FSL R7-0345]|uniref:hypothetical protein n=1 Tax=Paenibacillus sp. FSL R7-0345 TaxID=2954535 RepID=UPI003159EC7D